MFGKISGISGFLMILILAADVSGQSLREDVWDVRMFPSGTEAGYFDAMNGGLFGVTICTGDFNGDGNRDVVASPFYGNTLDRERNGAVYIMFGDGTIDGEIDIANYDGPHWVLHGAADNSLAGFEVIASDLNDDGIDDLIFSAAHGLEPEDLQGAGQVTILYGSEEWNTAKREIDLATMPEDLDYRIILGPEQGHRLGPWYSAADIDGNGSMDLVAGMDQSDGPQGDRLNAGAIVVLWDIANVMGEAKVVRMDDDLFMENVTVLHGIDNDDHLGATVLVADVDSNGKIDIVGSAGVIRSGLQVAVIGYVGAGGGDGIGNMRDNSGETTIFWDAEDLKNLRSVDLRTDTELEKTTIYGEFRSDYLGEELITGDFNGDGQTDLFVGALTGSSPTLNNAGTANLFLDTPTLRAVEIVDMASPPDDFVVTFHGSRPSEWLGDTLEMMDINGDGKDELFLALPAGTPYLGDARTRVGYIPVIVGGQEFSKRPQRVVISTSSEDLYVGGFIVGSENNDLLSYSSALGDMDGDGITDYLATAMQGDGFQNAYSNAGEYYIFSGATILARLSKPRRVVLNTESETLLQWNAAEPMAGPITGYEVVYTRAGVDNRTIVTDPVITRSQLGGVPSSIAVRTVMNGANGVAYSEFVSFEIPMFSSIWIVE